MRTYVDDRLRREAARHRLLFTCEHCAHFDDLGVGCSQGFPTDEHRDARLEVGGTVVFCKAFEGS